MVKNGVFARNCSYAGSLCHRKDREIFDRGIASVVIKENAEGQLVCRSFSLSSVHSN